MLPDEHNNANFGNIVPNNFPRLLDHLDLLPAEVRSSINIRISLSKLRFCRQTWYCAAHYLQTEKKNPFAPIQEQRKRER